MTQNYYLLLGIKESASREEVQEAFRRLAKIYHPDVSGGETKTKFLKIQEGWETLQDEKLRREYDVHLQRRLSHQAWPGKRFGDQLTSASRRAFRKESTGLGQELELELVVTAWEAARGGIFPINLPRWLSCNFCGGSGRTIRSVCIGCAGAGLRIGAESANLYVQPGLADGAVITVSLNNFRLVHGTLVIRLLIMD